MSEEHERGREREGGEAPEALFNLQLDRTGATDNRRWRYGTEDLSATPYAGPGRWRQVGPDPLHVRGEQIFQGAGTNSGQVLDIAIDPRGGAESTIYLATSSGGVWKSTDSGRSWKPLTDFLRATSIGAIALDPDNPDIVYAGSGNLFEGAGGMPKAAGLFKSLDGGLSWGRITSPLGRGPQPITAAANVAGGVRLTVVGHGFVTGDRIAVVGLLGISGLRTETTARRIDDDHLRSDARTLTGAYGGAGAQLFDARQAPFLSDAGIIRLVCPAPGMLLVAAQTGLYLSVDGGRSFGANKPAYDDGRPIRTGLISSLELDTGATRVARVQDATAATPVVLTVARHGFGDGDRVSVGGVTPNLPANGAWVIDRIDDDHLSLRGSSSGAAGAATGMITGPAHPGSVPVQDATHPAAPAPIVVRAAAHGFVSGDVVAVSGVAGNVAANRSWEIRVLGPDNFELVGSHGTVAATPNTGTVDGPSHRAPLVVTAAANVVGGIELTAAGHGLVDGDQVSVLGLPGLAAPANSGSVRRLDDNRFRIAGLHLSAAYGGVGGSVSGPAESWNTVYFVSAGRIFLDTALNPDRGLFRLTFTSTGDVVLSDNLLSHPGGVPGAFGRVAFAQSTLPRNRTLYASVQDGEFAGQFFVGLFRSDNFGRTWSLRPNLATRVNKDGAGQTSYDLTLGVDPQHPERVYAGLQQLWLSTDSGGTWPQVTLVDGGGDSPTFVSGSGRSPSTTLLHWDHHELVFQPPAQWAWAGANPVPITPVYLGTDGGIARADDNAGVLAFTHLNEGIATALLRHIDIGRGAGRNAATFGGMQDTGTAGHRTADASGSWSEGVDGDGGHVAVDPANPDVVFGFDNGGLMRTTNGGDKWFLAGFPPSPIIVDVQNTNPVRVVTTGHPFRTGDPVSLAGVTGGSGIANGASTVTVVDSNTFTLNGKNGTIGGAFDVGPRVTGTRFLTSHRITAATMTAPIQIETDLPHGCNDNDRVRVDAVLGVEPANNNDGNPTWTVTRMTATRLSLNGSDGTLAGPYVAGTGRLRGPGTAGFSPVQRAENANPIVVTAVGHGLVSGDLATVAGVRGNTAANCVNNAIRALDANSFALVGRVGSAASLPPPRVTFGLTVGRGLPGDTQCRVSVVPNGALPATQVFAAFGSTLFRSNNAGITFVPMFTFPDNITALATPAPNRLWVGTAGRTVPVRGGQVFFSNNGGTSYLTAGANNFVRDVGARGTVAAIAVDPTDATGNRVAVVIAGYGGAHTRRRTRHCFLTTTGGIGATPWTELGGVTNAAVGNLPDLPVLGVGWDTTAPPPAALLVATDLGVLRLGAANVWQRVGPDLPAVSCQALAIDNTVVPPVIRVGTYGRSAWEFGIPAGASLHVEADLGFGEQPIGTPARRTVVLHSCGAGPVTVSSFSVPGGDFALDAAPGFPLVLVSGTRRSIDLVFTPSVAGLRGAQITVSSDDPEHPAVQLKATGVAVPVGAPRLQVRGFVEFDLVSSITPLMLPLEIRNVGLGPLSIAAITLDPVGNAAFTLPGLPALPLAVPAGGSASINVRFAPTANGAVTSSVLITGNGQGAVVNLSGTGSTIGTGVLAMIFDLLGVGQDPQTALA